MNNTVQRLLLFFIGIPGFVLLVLFLPIARHLPVVVLAGAISVLCTKEMIGMLRSAGGDPPSARLMVTASVTTSAATYAACLQGFRVFPSFSPEAALLVCTSLWALIIFVPVAFARADGISQAVRCARSGLLVLFYPGLLSAFWILLIAGTEDGAAAIFTFTLMTFGNDSLAWLFGMLFGKNRGIVAVSPNKSIEGFGGGMVGSVIASVLAGFIFHSSFAGARFMLPLLGALTGLAVIAGDLFESALKRMAGMKDSGTIVPGRGGMLDSFDSLLFAAPVFYAFSRLSGYFL